jgi:hypothetical protein
MVVFHASAKCSSRTESATLASSGEMTPQTQPIAGGSKGVIGQRDRVADDDAFGSDEDLFNHAA